MACVWVHPSIVQFTFLPTSSPKGMDCDCMVQVCLSFGLETEMIRIFLALFKEKGLSDTHYTPSSLHPSRAVEPFTVQLAP